MRPAEVVASGNSLVKGTRLSLSLPLSAFTVSSPSSILWIEKEEDREEEEVWMGGD